MYKKLKAFYFSFKTTLSKKIFAYLTYPSHFVVEQSLLINQRNVIFCFNMPPQRMVFEKGTLHEGSTTTNGNNNIEFKFKLPD